MLLKTLSLILILNAADIQVSCDQKNLIVQIGKLRELTKSRMETVSYEALSPRVCQAVLKEFRPHEGEQVSVSVMEFWGTWAVEGPYCDEEICSGTFRSYGSEYVNLKISDIPLVGRKIIPGTDQTRHEEWDPSDCPPNAPDCDL